MSIRILIVDDNRETLRVYTKALRRRGMMDELMYDRTPMPVNTALEIEEADTVVLAIEKLRTLSYDILVVDLKIPGYSEEEMGGLQIIAESLNLDPLRPIIVITGYGSVALARKTLTQGVFDFIEKSQTAVDELVDSVKRALTSRDNKIRRSRNPFTPMTGIDPTVFGGRKNELEFFEDRLNRAVHGRFCEHFLVLGNWGIGKSTLLKEYKKICQSRGHIATVVPVESFQPGTGLVEVVRSLLGGILRGIPYQIDRLTRVASYFDSIGINVLGTGIEFSRDTNKKEVSPQSLLHDTLVKLWHDLKKKAEVIVILFDDVENFISVSEIFATLKSTLSMESLTTTRILIGMATRTANWLELTKAEKYHALARYFLARVNLGLLSDSEVRQVVVKSLIGTGVTFSTDVVNLVVEHSQGHPFEVQLLCYHLFENQLSNRVEVDVWDQALRSSVSDMGFVIFDNWFAKANREEAEILRIIAKHNLPISTSEIRRTAERENIGVAGKNIPRYLQHLADKGLLEKKSRGSYTISDRMFRAYLGKA